MLLSCFTGNGIIEFPEFVDLMSRRPWGKQGSHEELRDAFESFDNEGFGFISAAELRYMLTNNGEALTDEELDQMLSRIPSDGDGNIPLEGENPRCHAGPMLAMLKSLQI